MAQFSDFNFKLVVLEQLMYTDEVLTPRYSFADALKAQGITTGPWEHAHERGLDYQVVPEVREHFERLEVPTALLSGVTEVVMDGGLQIYQECAPVWDGEDDLFDVRSLADLPLVPNLRRVIGSEFLGPALLAELTAAGIEAD